MDEVRADPEPTAEASTVDTGYALAERVRAVSFRVARRGYDRDEVDGFLAWLADELRSAEVGVAAGDVDPDALRRELERVGESTAGILRAAEQTAREIRATAKRDAENRVTSATAEAERLRSEAEEFSNTTRQEVEEETRRVRLDAGQRAEEAVREAEGRAESVLEDSMTRRRLLDSQIEDLTERRDAILTEIGRLAEELQGLGDSQVIEAPGGDADEEADGETAGEEEDEGPTLLVDPDEDGDAEETQIQPGISDEATEEFATFPEGEGEGEADGDRR